MNDVDRNAQGDDGARKRKMSWMPMCMIIGGVIGAVITFVFGAPAWILGTPVIVGLVLGSFLDTPAAKRSYLAMCAAMGILLGSFAAALLDGIAIGITAIVAGIGIGLAVGAVLQSAARKKLAEQKGA